MEKGWISLHRKILNNLIVTKDSDYFSVWVYLLLKATHTEYDEHFNGKIITLVPGQLVTGRKVIAKQFNLSESKVQRILKKLEIEQLIEQRTSPNQRLITVINYKDYQSSEQRFEQRLNNERTTTEQRLNTYNNNNNNNNNIYNSEQPKNKDETLEQRFQAWKLVNPMPLVNKYSDKSEFTKDFKAWTDRKSKYISEISK